MINKLFILNFFTVTLVEFAGVGGMAPESGGVVPTIQIICDEVGTDPIAEKFNTLVTKYFVKNFGDGGKKYLDFVRTGAREGAEARACHGMPSKGSRAYKESQKIVSVFDPSSSMWNWFIKKKELNEVRFRVHRFLGILSLCAGMRNFECKISRSIDYYSAFHGSERKDLNALLKRFKSSLQGEGLIDMDETYLQTAVPQMVSDCLRAIGRATLMGSNLGVIVELCPIALKNYKEKCGGTVASEGVVQTETCLVLPQVMDKMAEGNEVSISFGLNMMFGSPGVEQKSVYQHLQNVLKQCAPKIDVSTDSTNTHETIDLIGLVKRLIPLTLYGIFGQQGALVACSKLVIAPPTDRRGDAIVYTCDTIDDTKTGCSKFPSVEGFLNPKT